MCHELRSRTGFPKVFFYALLAACTGCASRSVPNSVPVEGDAGGNVDKSTTPFESDDPSHHSETVSAADAAAGAAAPSAEDGRDNANESDAARTIAEADVIQVDGDRLYALSQFGGLAIIDISVPESLKMLGRRVVQAQPFEMYVRSGVAYAMYSSFPSWTTRADGSWESHTTSRLVAFDVHDPTAITEVGAFEVPGEVSDSRMVGDVLYVVSYENGNCWHCSAAQPRTTVTSIAVGAPASIHQVAQLGFDDQRNSWSWYRRSISVNTQRMYVSGMVYDGSWGADTGHSTIQVVDISDPAGTLALGAEVPVTGQIESRWQMDELDGVLRTISQSGTTWSNGPAPTVETFRVTSAQAVSRLGSLTLTLPKKENLKSVRFDGTRAYAVTFEQKDPLFTLDLTDPASPKQVGSVEMPGYLFHMEPRGDRLIALGMDNGNAAGGFTVSIFDVSNLATPTMLSRANFGGSWGWAPEDQDRIHKAFKIFDEVGLISMPFAGYTYTARDGGGGCSEYISGVQLLDFTRDTVTARGIVPIRGQAKRAFLHDTKLFAMSDDQVASFDITNRDAPQRLGSVALANTADKTVRVGANLVALGADWYTQSPQIVVLPVNGGPSALPLATIDLGGAIASSSSYCWGGYWSSFSSSSQLFVNGNLVYVVYDARFAAQRGQIGFAVIDLTDPTHPVLAGHKLLSIGTTVTAPSGYYYNDYYYGCGIGYYNSPDGLLPSGERVVQVGSTLVLQELVPNWSTSPAPYAYPESKATIHSVDVSDPANIRLLSSTVLSDGTSASGLFTRGNMVLTSHFEGVSGTPGRVRFYLDRLDVSNPAAPTRDKVNVPGSLFGVDQTVDRVVTVDYARTVEPVDTEGGSYWANCQNPSAFGTSWITYKQVDAGTSMYYSYSQPESCIRVDRSLKLVDLSGGTVTLLDTLVPGGERISNVLMGQDRLFLTRQPASGSTPQLSVEVVSGIRSGDLVSGASIDVPGYGYLVSSQSDARFVLNSDSYRPKLTVYDTSNPTAPTKLLEADVASSSYYGWAHSITLDPEYVIVAMGHYGATAVPLTMK